jgi:hypothetical protein
MLGTSTLTEVAFAQRFAHISADGIHSACEVATKGVHAPTFNCKTICKFWRSCNLYVEARDEGADCNCELYGMKYVE